jgi:hypothetical protein
MDAIVKNIANTKRKETLRAFWASEKGIKVRKKISKNNLENRDYSITSQSLKDFWDSKEGLTKRETSHSHLKGITRPNEVKDKISLKLQGHAVSQKTRDAVSKAQKDRKHSKETIAKRSVGIEKSKISGKYWENLQKGLKLRPNKFEQKVAVLLPYTFLYT